jgi:hypothetical protein
MSRASVAGGGRGGRMGEGGCGLGWGRLGRSPIGRRSDTGACCGAGRGGDGGLLLFKEVREGGVGPRGLGGSARRGAGLGAGDGGCGEGGTGEAAVAPTRAASSIIVASWGRQRAMGRCGEEERRWSRAGRRAASGLRGSRAVWLGVCVGGALRPERGHSAKRRDPAMARSDPPYCYLRRCPRAHQPRTQPGLHESSATGKILTAHRVPCCKTWPSSTASALRVQSACGFWTPPHHTYVTRASPGLSAHGHDVRAQTAGPLAVLMKAAPTRILLLNLATHRTQPRKKHLDEATVSAQQANVTRSI